jgi:nicotinamide mononucleotide transporter
MSFPVDLCIEIFGVVTALVYVYLEIKQRWSMWMVGIASSAVYAYVFFRAKFYADAALSVYYVFASVYGAWCWRGGRASTDGARALPITRTTPRQGLAYASVAIVLWVALRAVLVRWTDSPVPTGDSFTTALSIVGMAMLARKRLEQWHVWAVVNVVSAGLYFYKDLYPTAGLYVVYTALSFYGFWRWKRHACPIKIC